MARLPGQWDGKKWVCGDKPEDTATVYHFCCPEGWRKVSRKSIQATGTRYGYSSFKTTRMACPETEEGLLACGPRPSGNVKCCPEMHIWVDQNTQCPMPQARRGVDLDFMSRLQLQSGASAQPGDLGSKLTMISIPFLIAIAILMYFIFVN